MLKPSGLERRLHPPGEAAGGDHGVLEVLVGDLDQVGGVRRAGTTSACPRGRRVDVHEGDRVLVGVDDLRRDVAGDDPAEEAVASAPSAAAAYPGAAIEPPGEASIASSRPFDLAGEDGGLDLAEQPAELGPGLDAELGGELVPGDRRARRAVAVPVERRADHLAGQVEVGLDHLRSRDRALPARGEAVGDGEQGDVGATGSVSPQVVVDPPAGERALVDQEARAAGDGGSGPGGDAARRRLALQPLAEARRRSRRPRGRGR